MVQTIQKMAHGGGENVGIMVEQGSHKSLVWMRVMVREWGMGGLGVMEAVVAGRDMDEVGGSRAHLILCQKIQESGKNK